MADKNTCIISGIGYRKALWGDPYEEQRCYRHDDEILVYQDPEGVTWAVIRELGTRGPRAVMVVGELKFPEVPLHRTEMCRLYGHTGLIIPNFDVPATYDFFKEG